MSKKVELTPEQEEMRMNGLRILAGMIVKAYLKQQRESPQRNGGSHQQDQPPGVDPEAPLGADRNVR